jgi:hypothetical protein
MQQGGIYRRLQTRGGRNLAATQRTENCRRCRHPGTVRHNINGQLLSKSQAAPHISVESQTPGIDEWPSRSWTTKCRPRATQSIQLSVQRAKLSFLAKCRRQHVDILRFETQCALVSEMLCVILEGRPDSKDLGNGIVCESGRFCSVSEDGTCTLSCFGLGIFCSLTKVFARWRSRSTFFINSRAFALPW